MPDAIEDEVIQKLKDSARQGDLTSVDVTYRLAGGAPGEQPVDDVLNVSGPGLVTARTRSPARAVRESSENLAAPEMNELLLKVAEGLSELIPSSQARFIPDSIVGRISVKIEGKEASFFFLPDESQAEQHAKVLSPKAASAVNSLMRLHERVVQREEDTP